jgi:uncharacterized protein (DUF885 family)
VRKLLVAGLLCTSLMSLPAFSDANADMERLVADYWANLLKEEPVFASARGVDTYADQLRDYSLAGRDRRAASAADFLQQLRAIPEGELSADAKVDYRILERLLRQTIEANGMGQRAINFTNRSGWHQTMAGMAGALPFRNKADYENYNRRLQQYGRVNEQAIAVANVAIEGQYTLPCDALEDYENSITGLIAKDVVDSRFYEPYTRDRPDSLSAEEFEALSRQAAATLDAVIHPALREHGDWYLNTYKPACAKAPGASAQPGGEAYYDFLVRLRTTTTLSAGQIHDIGLAEVARIRAAMVEVAKLAGYDSREGFIEHLRTDPQYYASTPEQLMEKVARQTKLIDGKVPGLFGKLPRLPYGIKAIPADRAEGDATAYYNSGSPELGIAGFYYVNTSKLDQRPFWEIPALSVHEAVPGHHLQIALQQELPLSDFRKFAVHFTAFVEGWGLYSEHLGIDMGIYDTPAKDMGRLSYEMWRACRLVVDTGIHAMGWSKARAIAYMKDNTALSDANIEAEVNRYISWPGQALAYKIGELKIRELREYAAGELGQNFRLATFHDVVLDQGAVPLDLLDARVKEWVARQQ